MGNLGNGGVEWTYWLVVAVAVTVFVTGFSMQEQILAIVAAAAEENTLRAEACAF